MCLAAPSGDLGADKLGERKWPFKGPWQSEVRSDKKFLPYPLKRFFSLPRSFSAWGPVPEPGFLDIADLTRRMCMHFRPLHDRVLVRRIDAEEKTAGGIIIPDTAKEKPQEGEIVAAGPGARNEQGQLIPIDVKLGDRVLFGKWSGTEVKIDGQDYLIMKESDLLGVVDKAGSARKAA
jgi:chaperonin GroES